MFASWLPAALLILVIVLILFGAQRLPDLARSLGQSRQEVHEGCERRKDDTSAARQEGRREEGVTIRSSRRAQPGRAA